jgi:hemolysin activation/secretion protein
MGGIRALRARAGAGAPWALAAAALMSFPHCAAAQGVQPGGRVTDQFERPALPESQAVAPYRIDRPRAAAPADAFTFAVRSILVEGAAGVPVGDIEALTAPIENRIVSFADLAALTDRITALYAARGFALSFALLPEQTVTDGVVRIRIVEGSLDAVTVGFSGPTPPAGRGRVERAIRRRLQPLIQAGPVRSADLERVLLGIDDLDGLDVSFVVRPSPQTEGAASLDVIVTGRPFAPSLGIDNRLRSEFGREEGLAAITVGSSLIVGDRIDLTARHSLDEDGFAYASAGYSAPIGDSLARVHADYSIARTQAQSGLLGLLEYRGREESFAAGVRYPLIRSRARTLTVGAEISGIDTRSSLLGTTVVRENIRMLAGSVAYDWADGAGARSLATFRLTQGIEGLGATDAANPLRSRANGRPDATFVNLRMYRDQPLPAGLRLRVDVEAQATLSSGGLLAANECTFGGPAIGRGYDAGVISGDDCIRAGAELARPMQAGPAAIEPYAFLDWGLMRQRGVLEAGEERDRDATSFGFGLRLFSRIGINADLQLAWPGETLTPGEGRDPRLFFSISFQR